MEPFGHHPAVIHFGQRRPESPPAGIAFVATADNPDGYPLMMNRNVSVRLVIFAELHPIVDNSTRFTALWLWCLDMEVVVVVVLLDADHRHFQWVK
jgi:hypothetical protein